MNEDVKPVDPDLVGLSTDTAGTSTPAATEGQQADTSPAVQPTGG